MTARRRVPFAGVLVTAAVLLTVALLWRLPGGNEESTPAAATPTQGGQLVVSIRSEPPSLNRLVSANAGTELLTLLTQGRLVRLNRVSWEIEPWLAASWKSSADGRVHTLALRRDVTWSDGTPFTSADVLFTVKAVFDPGVGSVLASSLQAGERPVDFQAPDPYTVVMTFDAPSALGVALLDNLPIFPRHKLEAALTAGTLKNAWPLTTAPADLAGTGPFVLREYVPRERLVLERNPRYWRTSPSGSPLPYLDRLVLQLVPNSNAEILRLQAGEIDLIQDAIATDDYALAKRAEQDGSIRMIEVGVATDADALWFCLKPEQWKGDRRFAFVQRPEFRQALSHVFDREDFARTVFLNEAVPVWGPVTPGNRVWSTPNLPRYTTDVDRARAIMKDIGLVDRNGDGLIEDASGAEARFKVMYQQGVTWSSRAVMLLKEQAARAGVVLDLVPLEASALISRIPGCSYEAIYMRPLATSLDPGGNMDFWLSSGAAHAWNIGQRTPATAWEREIDALMREQAVTLDPAKRRELFLRVQTIFARNLPMLHFAAPRLWAAYGPRVAGIQPSVMRPHLLWAADSLSVSGAGTAGD